MKKIILFTSILLGLNSYSQNTIPTTTCTGALKINDSLNVNKDITAMGDITSKGEVVSTDTLRAKEDVLASKDIKVEGSVYVNQDVSIEGKLTAKGGLTFDGVKGLFYTPPTNTSGSIFSIGAKVGQILPYFQCTLPSSEPWSNFYHQGNFVTYHPADPSAQFPLVNSALRMGIASWNGNALIDVSGVDANGQGNNGLDINYFCKRNTTINRGWDLDPNHFMDGGTVYMGAKVDMQSSLKLGWSPSGNIDLNTSIEINQNGNNANGVKLYTWNNTVKAFSIERADGKNTFLVYGSGKTQIGIGTPKVGGSANNAMLSVDGLILAKEIKVAIANTHWADFVFEKNYKLMPLKDVELYINKNKHLPAVPSALEVEEEGVNLVEINATLLKKIEELTLYLIEQNKRIELLEKKQKH